MIVFLQTLKWSLLALPWSFFSFQVFWFTISGFKNYSDGSASRSLQAPRVIDDPSEGYFLSELALAVRVGTRGTVLDVNLDAGSTAGRLQAAL
jgi:hypothetical protein